MDSSSEDEGVFIRRKSTTKKIFDSDDESNDKVEEVTEATEDFKLHLSDEDDDDGFSVQAKIEAALAEQEREEESAKEVEKSDDLGNGKSISKTHVAHKSANASGNQGTTDIMKKLTALAGSDSESDVDGDLEPISKTSKKSTSSSKKNTFDSDSDSNSDNQNLHLSDDETKKFEVNSKVKKNKAGPVRKSKTKAKDAMLEIKAESQRQLRQSNIGLPYHVPKQRSLLDFLNRRKSSSPMPIKGTAEQLAAAWKQIEEREKEVEEFYKSESEQESDEDNDKETLEEEQLSEQPAAEPSYQKPEEEIQFGSSHAVTASNECSNEKPDAPISSSLQNKKDISEAIEAVLTMEETLCDSAEKMDTGDIIEAVVTGQESVLCINQITEESADTIYSVAKAICSNGESQLETNSLSLEKPMAQKRGPGLTSQGSQDISLHYSETQCATEENADVPNVKSSEENSSSSVSPSKKEDDEVKDNSTSLNKNKKDWEELNAAMKTMGNDSESDDDAPEKTVPKKSALDSGPRLSLKGAPNDVIDLDDLSSNPSRTPGVKGLIERFMKHSASKKKPLQAQNVELSVISSEKDTCGGVIEVKHESLTIVLAGDDNPRSDNMTPGARLKLLKTELNRQMRKQKEEEWQKKREEMKNDEVFKGEKDDCGMSPDDEEEEEEMTDSEAESEPEIDDVREPKRKKKSRSMYVDEEAEVEDDDDCAVGVYDNEDSEDDENDNADDDNDDNNESDKNEDDHDEENEEVSSKDIDQTQNAALKGSTDDNVVITGGLRRTMTSASSDLFASQSSQWRLGADDDDDFIPAGQPNRISRDESFNEKADDEKEPAMLFSPMSLTIPGRTQSFMDIDQEITPTKLPCSVESKPQSALKKLFGESQTFSTQDKLKEIAGLFAEKFNDSQAGLAGLANVSSNDESQTDLMALCSGKFVTQPPQPYGLEEDCGQGAGSSSQFSSQTPEASQVSTLLAEDSVDFSLKFDGDANAVEKKRNAEDTDERSNDATEKFRLEIMSSDEEDNTSLVRGKKKKNRKLEFSDDEDENPSKTDAEDSESEQSDIGNDKGEEFNQKNNKLFGIFSKPSQEVFYDSDENEIEPGDFLEKEAELSEEEDWHGSDDEDEKGLDQLEMDEADKEDIDQDLVREQLVKSHMQKMLDEDRRDVRVLQEMLLEDGELHSDTGGRERQFRWKNVDSSGMGDDGHRSDEENAENDDEEEDAEWRKQRHEREMFLKEQREKQKKEVGCLDDDDEVLENSELLQLGKSVLFKSRSSSLEMSAPKDPPPKLTVHNQLLSPEGKRSNLLLTKRGSFLSRGDSILAKLAKITGPAKENVLAGAKTGGNFVFSAVSPTKKESQAEENSDQKSSKRKACAGLPNPAGKKPCLVTPVRKSSGLFDHL